MEVEGGGWRRKEGKEEEGVDEGGRRGKEGKEGKEKEVRMKKKKQRSTIFFKSVFDFVSSFLTFSGSIACTSKTCLSFLCHVEKYL